MLARGRRALRAGWVVMQWPLALFVPLSQLIAAFKEEWENERHREGAPHPGCGCLDCGGARDAADG